MKLLKLFFFFVLFFALATSLLAQRTVDASYSHDVNNIYSIASVVNGTGNDTTNAINPFTKGAVQNTFTLYTYAAQAHDSVYIKIYRETQGIDNHWAGTTLVGIDSSKGSKVWNDTISYNFLKVRYVFDGANSSAKKNGVATAYTVKVLNQRVKLIKLE